MIQSSQTNTNITQATKAWMKIKTLLILTKKRRLKKTMEYSKDFCYKFRVWSNYIFEERKWQYLIVLFS